jgi:hypothetical protein
LTFVPQSGSIVLTPDLNTPTGVLDYYYVVTMVDYPSRTVTQNFQVEVGACLVKQIRSNSADIADQQMLWADDKITVDATVAFDSFTQFPDCQYDFQFTPLVMTQNGPINFNIANSAIFF